MSLSEKPHLLIIGGGPSGLAAAEAAIQSGTRVTLAEGKRSVGRKFLVAGRRGLNLTNAEDFSSFLDRYGPTRALLRDALLHFSPEDLRQWAADLGFETFESAGGKVFPHVMKAAPLLRAWVQRLKDQGVTLAVNHRWTGLTAPPPGEPGPLRFHFGEHPDIVSDAAILALGGASWPETGSDGKWPSLLQSHHVRITPWSPANCGWNANWPAEISQLAGTPLKNIVAKVGSSSKAGELVITKTGLEGGPLYHLGPTLRATHPVALTLDLKPTLSLGEVEDRLSSVKKNYVREASRRLNLCRAAGSLLKHLPALGPWRDPKLLAAVIKACPIPLTSPRPVSEAISSAGGVSWDEIDQSLMLRRLPGVYICGEMIDWEAPTGGYLLQASMATGRLAAHRASLRLRNSHL